MPRNPRGMKGLGAVIRYAIELRTWNDMGEGNDASTLTGIAATLSEIFRAKAREVKDLKESTQIQDQASRGTSGASGATGNSINGILSSDCIDSSA